MQPTETRKMEKKVYTTDEIAEILNIGKASAYHLVNSGKFSVLRLGHLIRIPKENFDKWMESNS